MPIIPLSDFDYHLPPELIGQKPIKPRDSARLLVLNRGNSKLSHKIFSDLPEILRRGDVLVFNDSKVIPARLHGCKESGGKIEIFLLKKLGNEEIKKLRMGQGNYWQVLIGGKSSPKQRINLGKGVKAEIIKRLDEKTWLARFNAGDKKLFGLGETPLPPYIKSQAKLEDYQTIYAKHQGSVAAPTAGLHFSKRLIDKLKKRGVQIEYVTLHVGLGTFAPVKESNILEHKIHSELGVLEASAADRLNRAKSAGRQIIAVGTTSVRILEAFSDKRGRLKPQKKWIDIFIYRGYEFKFVDALITNFHLPKSTLLMLICAFAGRKKVLKAYQEAIRKKYRFYSFGDGMMIK